VSDLPTELVEMDARALPLASPMDRSRVCESWDLFFPVFNQQIGEHFPFQDSGMFSRSVESTNLVLGWLCSYKFV